MYNWIPIIGKFEVSKENIIFKGGEHIYDDPTGKKISGSKFGIIMSDKIFNDGSIFVEVKFNKIDDRSLCEIIFNYDSPSGNYLSIGINGAGSMFGLSSLTNGKLEYYKRVGEHENLKPGKVYKLKLILKGNRVRLFADNVEVISHILPFNLLQTQVGLLCMGQTDVSAKNFSVVSERPKVFMIMQFSEKYNDIYEEVIKEVCSSKDYDLNVLKADEIYGPGIIISDIIRFIFESKIIIAEISPANANVYYEVGYAHALNKPTILIAEKDTKAPFDISPFRVLFYENTIAGKKKIQEGLKKHLDSILNQ